MHKEGHTLHNKSEGIDSLDALSLIELLNIAHDLKQALSAGHSMESGKNPANYHLMSMLFQYLVKNMDIDNIDATLLKFLEEFLGIHKKKRSKKKAKEEDEDLESEQEQEMDNALPKAEKDRRLRLAMYEMYKILNPHQLAGESALENFINNVRTRGVHEAMKYEGSEYITRFDKHDLENLESYKTSFVQSLRDQGAIGGGRGL